MRKTLFCFVIALLLAGCMGTTPTPTPTKLPIPTLAEAPIGLYDESIKPEKGQPAFPKLEENWVADPNNSCNFNKDVVNMAYQTFEALRQEHIAEVAVVCQVGIKGNGPMNDGKIWAMEWGRYTRLGDKQDRRAIVWLIQPDVRPQDGRVTIEISTWLVWYTAIDYGPGLDEAAMYANSGDFSGALESIIRTTNAGLRLRWTERSTTP